MSDKTLKYFCKNCKTVRGQFFAVVWDNPDDDKTKREIEVIKTWETSFKDNETGEQKKATFKGKKLECGHFVRYETPGFKDISENLSEYEASVIRQTIEKEMIGKDLEETKNQILYHVDQYQTLLKISSKQVKQAKYAIQYLDQLREKYSKVLANDADRQSFEMKFAHFLDQKPTTVKTIERERTSVEREKDKKDAALEAVRALLGKSGYQAKDIFAKSKEELRDGE